MLESPISQIAKMIDHALLHPTLTDDELRSGCQLARKYQVASVCIKPYAVSIARDLLTDSDVAVSTVVGFPHGSNTTSLKVEETLKACQDGATEIDMVVNIGKVLSNNWTYVAYEIQEIQTICKLHGAILKVIFENDFLPNDTFKIQLCEICTEIGVAFVKTSTGFGFVKDSSGKYDYKGATLSDLQLMIKHVGPSVQVKASGGIRTLNELLVVKELGVTRIGTSATAAILNEVYNRFGESNKPHTHHFQTNSESY